MIGRHDLNEKTSFRRLASFRIKQDEIRTQGFMVFPDAGRVRLVDVVSGSNGIARHIESEREIQDEFGPVFVIFGIVSLFLPLLVVGPELRFDIALVVGFVQAVREDLFQNRNRQERARDFDQRQPLGMQVRSISACLAVASRHIDQLRPAMLSGTRKVTATGNRRGTGSA